MEDPAKTEFSTQASVLIGIGSNLGDRTANIEEAIQRMDRLPDTSVIKRAPMFETEPVGGPADQPDFLNTAVELTTRLEPLDLLRHLQTIELSLGRQRTVVHGPRTIDLDMLLYEDRTIELPDLIVPHPRLSERRFVLEPLAALASQRVHPVLNRTLQDLLSDLRNVR